MYIKPRPRSEVPEKRQCRYEDEVMGSDLYTSYSRYRSSKPTPVTVAVLYTYYGYSSSTLTTGTVAVHLLKVYSSSTPTTGAVAVHILHVQ